jgi:hypothetical protein
MPTKFIPPQAIKWVDQRALADHWDRLAAGRPFPEFTELKSEPGTYDPNQFVVWNVEGQGRQRKFRVLYQGENVAKVFNSNWMGETMDQVVPMSLRRFTMKATKECVASGCIIYTIVSTIDASGHRVDCEGLLLPFGRNGSVEQILTSLRLKSIQGRVQRKKILGNFQSQTDVLFSGKMKSGFVETNPASMILAIDANEIAPGADSEPNTRLRVSKTDEGLSKRANAAVGENRRAPRRAVLRAGRISFADEGMTCTVRNISAIGASIGGANLNGIPDNFTLVLEMESTARLCTVVWRNKTQIGVRFS